MEQMGDMHIISALTDYPHLQHLYTLIQYTCIMYWNVSSLFQQLCVPNLSTCTFTYYLIVQQC